MRETCGPDDSSSSFLVIGDGGGGGGGENDGDGQRHFVRTLDSKLRRLQQRHRGGGGKQHASRKPIFVTTVKTGIFLDPPPDLAALLGLDDRSSSSAPESDRFYSYSSEPRVLYDKQHQRVSAASAAGSYSRGAADRRRPDICKQMGYTNIMHDKRVVRGSNFAKKTFRPKWNPYFGYAKQLSAEFGKESPAAREAEARRRAMARKKAMDYQTRALRLHLGGPKLTRGRQNVDIQTDSHLEELYEHPPCPTTGTQTEFYIEPSTAPITRTSVSTDASTQVDEQDLFDFNTEVARVAESLIVDVFEQSMREVLYEDELATRARQQRALHLRLVIEQNDLLRLKHEDERLNEVKVQHARLFDEGEKNEKSRVSALTSERVTELLPEELKNQNSEEFVSWVVEKLKDEPTESSDETLKTMIQSLVENRLDVYNKVADVQNIQKPVELFEEIESITSQPDQK